MKTLFFILITAAGLAQAAASSGFFPAVKAGSLKEVSRILHQAPLSISERDGDGLTALHLAAGRGNLEMVHLLLDWGADPFALDSKMAVSPLHKAVYSGNPKVVYYLVDKGAPVNLASPSNGDTPLHDAIYFKGKQGASVMQILLRYGASLSVRNKAGLTPIEAARVLGDKESESLLQAEEAKRFSPKGRALMKAVRAQDIDGVNRLLQLKETPVSEKDEDGFTPVIWAARSGYVEITESLLAHGASPNENDDWMKANAGHKAAFWGRAAIIPILAKYRWDVNAQGGYNGYTALHDAVARAHVDTVREIAKAGARWDIQGHDGKTALDLARALGNPEILAIAPH